MKIMFMGTPDIAVPCLLSLIENHEVVCVVTQPDRPKNRGHKMTMPPVKECALTHGIDVLQPEKLKGEENFMPFLEKYKPDTIVVIAYGKILPPYILHYPKYGCINVHASLLPKYRGAAPIQWAVINGEKVTGVTTMLMDEGLDTGDMLKTAEIKIDDDMTSGELYTKMSKVCPEVLLETLSDIDNTVPKKQNNELASYASMIDKKTATIDWNKDSRDIVNLIRGMNPTPCARTSFNGKLLKIYAAKPGSKSAKPGEVVSTDGVIEVGCKDGTVKILSLKPEGKREMSASDFVLGNKIKAGDMLI